MIGQDECPNCPRLEALIADLYVQINQLKARIEVLEEMRAGTVSTVGLIDRELKKASMPRGRLVVVIDERLREANQMPHRR